MRNEAFSVYDFIAHPVFVLAPDAKNLPVYQYLNAAALLYLDRPLDELRGLPAYEIFSGRSAYSVYQRQRSAWTKGLATDYEIALPINDRIIWVRTHLVPVYDSEGRLTHMVGTSHDISETRAALQVHAMDAALTREMEDLICFAAHDLRTPIGNLKSLAELMRADFVDHGDGKMDLIEMIETISDTALSVVGTIMSQAMGTSTPTSHERFDLGVLCEEIMTMLDPTRAHSLSYPCKNLEADSTAVHILLRNLVDNALKHCGRTSAQVVIEVSQVGAERLLFVVRDDGVGFADDPFTKQGVVRDGDTASFGLKGIRRLLRARDGVLSVAPPSNGLGAEVQFELPGRFVESTGKDEAPLCIA